MGTPHRGSDLAGILNFILLASFSSRQFIDQLNSNSDTIAAINNSFAHRVEPLKLISFFETESTRLQRVIPVQSTMLTVVASHWENRRFRNIRDVRLPERDQAWIEWRSHWNRKIQLKK